MIQCNHHLTSRNTVVVPPPIATLIMTNYMAWYEEG